MKNFIPVLLGILVLGPAAGAEAIGSVSFNPSRLGRYEQLKLTDGLSSEGGVHTQYMTVQSGGTVTVSNAGDYELTRSDVAGSVNMPGTRFDTSAVIMKGGKAGFTQSNKSSLIRRLTQNALKVKADVLEAGTVNVKGDASNTDYDGNSINVFKLGNNNIPKADTNCGNMEWVARTANDGKQYKVLAMTGCAGEESSCGFPKLPEKRPCGNGGEQTCTVTCDTSTGKWQVGDCGPCQEPKCTADARTKWNEAAQRCECPGSYDYWVNGACCSYSTPKTDTRCWTKEKSWVWTDKGSYHTGVDYDWMCLLSGDTYKTLKAPNGAGFSAPACTAAVGEACTTSGGQCVVSCEMIYNNGAPGLSKYEAHVKMQTCLQEGPETYKQRWNTSTDRPY